MNRLIVRALILAVSCLTPTAAWAVDPPHASICLNCHTAHGAPGATLTAVAGNANLCISCHMPGGSASAKPFSPNDQSYPAVGLAGRTASGTSHRWDSGPAGHVIFGGGAPIASTGRIVSLGTFAGPYAKTYTITITSPGAAGAAVFSWVATTPGGGGAIGVVTGAAGSPVALDQGISVSFTGATAASFQTNDRWYVYVRPDIQAPANGLLASRLENGLLMCSTCHNQHSQAASPFGTAPVSGAGRHYQRIANDLGQMCVECHAARNVTSSAQGSHPVGVGIPSGQYKNPVLLPLDAPTAMVRCQSCHVLHYAPSANGALLRVSNVTTLCSDCHTLADTAAPASHLDATAGVLWPGGQYGSTFPQKTDTSERGFCSNCHQPHGWPNAADTSVDYARLLVDVEENLCYTCHDANGPALRNVQAEFGKTYRHPLTSASGVHAPGEAVLSTGARHVECDDCHNSHRARPYTSPAPAPPNIAPVLAGLSGVTATGTVTDPRAGGAEATYEYQICFKCHADGANKPHTRTYSTYGPTPFRATYVTGQDQTNYNIRLQFESTVAPVARHPVTRPSAGTISPSVRTYMRNLNNTDNTNRPMGAGRYIYCSDCHSSNQARGFGGTAPNGPHGSTNAHLLERNYAVNTLAAGQSAGGSLVQLPHPPAYGPTGTYALCEKCHKISSTDGTCAVGTSPLHQYHATQDFGMSCSTCHSPHGVNNGTANNQGMVNFDMNLVARNTSSTYTVPTMVRSGNSATCYLRCHGIIHGTGGKGSFSLYSSGCAY